MAVDVIQYADQLGRLDFVSTLLAIIAILMALGGVAAFLNIKHDAKEAAEKVAKDETERFVNLYIQNNLSRILSEYDRLIDDHVNSTVANQIAQAQEDRKNGND